MILMKKEYLKAFTFAEVIWPHNVIIFQEHSAFGIKPQFIIRKEEPKVLARRASYDKKTLARQVIPLAPGYRTALSSRPVHVRILAC